MGPKAWIERLKSLGQALVELLEAEVDALGADLKGSARELGKAVALLAAAAFFVFWVIGGLALGAVEVLSLWLPRWGAVFTVTGFWGLVALIVGLLGRARLRRLEAPAQTVKRHLASHKEFVSRELLSGGVGEEPRESEAEPGGGPEGGEES